MPDRLDDEREEARRAGVKPVEVPSAEFDELLKAKEQMIYVVTGEKLVASVQDVGDTHISHAAIARGEDVHAAGQFTVDAERNPKVVTALNNVSGHYQPDEDSLSVAVEALVRLGLQVPAGRITPYSWEAL